MGRDHRRLRVFQAAHALALDIYRTTNNFPKDEWFGIRLQIRRAAVSVPANIVEGNARRTTRDYCHFLNIAFSSACELAYLLTLSGELAFIGTNTTKMLVIRAESVVRQLKRLQDEMEVLLLAEQAYSVDQRPATKDQRQKTRRA